MDKRIQADSGASEKVCDHPSTEKAVERVALALYIDDPITNFREMLPWDQIKPWSQEKYRQRARVAIAAVRSAEQMIANPEN